MTSLFKKRMKGHISKKWFLHDKKKYKWQVVCEIYKLHDSKQKKNEVMNGPYNLHFKKYKNDEDMDAIHAHLKIIYR